MEKPAMQARQKKILRYSLFRIYARSEELDLAEYLLDYAIKHMLQGENAQAQTPRHD